jgi:two-component system LytT family response regulator
LITINCVIIEDEPLAQVGLRNLLKPFASLEVVAVCDDIKDFLQFRESHPGTVIDLIFLDIELPGMNGIEFIRNMPLDIPVIVTTAYNQYAIEGYEINALDYLLKPISRERFSQAIGKAESYISYLKSKQSGVADFIYIRSDKAIEKIILSELFLVEAMRNYVIYHCENRRLICYNSLKNTESALPADTFVKVQKSFIVNKNKVQRIEKGYVYIKDKKIAITREVKNDIIFRLTGGNG